MKKSCKFHNLVLFWVILLFSLFITGCQINGTDADAGAQKESWQLTDTDGNQKENLLSTDVVGNRDESEPFTVIEKRAEGALDEGGSTEIIEPYSGRAYTEVNGSIPYFGESDLTGQSYETYSDLDSLGRCGTATAVIGKDIMPEGERTGIGNIKPTGWHTIKYNGIVEGNYLYNRCHLIGYQLTGENGNVKNLITGTRYMNTEGMLPFEDMVADYVKETGNHVIYRVTPVFEGDNLLASGVLMEAESVEDKGQGILFNVFCYNVQPGIVINYADGSSEPEKDFGSEDNDNSDNIEKNVSIKDVSNNADFGKYAVNGSNGKIHITGDCPATGDGENAMKNPVYFNSYEEAKEYSILIAPSQDKRKCGNCW